MIRRHPAADLAIAGVKSHLLQAGDQQIVFMHFLSDCEVPEHSHSAQWGTVLDGEMELVVEGEPRTLRRGDSYHLPAGVRHSARIRRGYRDVTIFDEKDRYRAAT
jgi:quercetin dioxygenase-like cupin family protein